MKKREFLSLGGAVPLMLAGCGGDGSGSAPVRLVNASVGYPTGLGFMVNTTQATTADVPYGSASPFETVEAGSVTTAITVSTTGTTASVSTSTRNLSKDSRYSLIAYGYLNELKSVLLTESTTAPDTGKANINVLNTSVDIGAVDVYISPNPITADPATLALATQIASAVNGVAQSIFSGVLASTAGTPYYIGVVGAGSVSRGVSDVRFVSPQAITLVDQQIMTVILTPGLSGTLANAIMLTQGTTGGTVSYVNSTARVRAVSAINDGRAVAVTSGTGASTITLLPATAQPNYSEYFVVAAGTGAVNPSVTIDGAALSYTGTLAAGGDYTLMVYFTSDTDSTPIVQLLQDDNTAPIGATGVKFRLINLARSTGLSEHLSMSVNSILAASNVGYGTASTYKELAVPQTTASVVAVLNGATTVKTLDPPQVLQAGRIFTEIVIDTTTTPVQDFFLASTDA